MWKLWIISILGTSLITVVSYLLYKQDINALESEYARRIDLIATTLENEITTNIESLYQLEPLYRHIPDVSDELFMQEAQKIISRYDSIQALEWIPVVKQENRQAFESSRRKTYRNFQITEKKNSSTMSRASIRDVYYPVSIVAPIKGNEAAIGFDLASNLERKNTIVSATSTGKLTATAGINLVQIEGQDKGFLVFLPIYLSDDQSDSDNQQLKGFVLGVFQSTQLLQNVLPENIKKLTHFQLFDVTNREEQLLTEKKTLNTEYSTLSVNVVLKDVAGRVWSFKATASENYLKENHSKSPVIVFILGCMFLFMMVKYVAHILTTSQHIERQVKTRTKDLDKSHRFITTLTNAVPTLLAYVDQHERFVFVNKNYQKIYNVNANKINGDFVKNTMSMASYNLLKKNIDLALNGHVVNFLDEIISDDDSYWFNVTYTPDRDSANQVIGFFISLEDVTSEKENEDKLQQNALEMKLKSKALEEAKNKAEAATQAKSSFLANMSHEIRTPLNGMLGTLSLLEDSKLTLEQLKYARLAQSSADILLTVINDILDISKIEAGKLTLENRSFDLSALVSSFNGVYKTVAQEKGLSFVLNYQITRPVYLYADEIRIKQILNNLTSNAIKFTENGSVNVTIELIPTADKFDQLKMSVQDTGIGIEASGLENLFSAFEQQDASTTRKYGGTGLGLAISQSIARMMSGEITVKSNVGQGSCFCCTIQVQKAEIDTERVAASAEIDGSILHNKKILLVEDNRVNQVVAKNMLTTLGCNVEIAENGLQALEILNSVRFDLVLMDCMMPIMDGYEATQKIRQKLSLNALPIIAMTANAMKGDKQKCLDFGMNDYISKPINKVKIKNILYQWLNESSASEKAAEI